MEQDLASLIFDSARAEGFPLVGAVDIDLARDAYPEHVVRYDRWLSAGYAGTMDYLVRGRDRRADPRVVFPGAESVVCVAIPYDPRPLGGATPAAGPRYARYLRHGDYHKEVAERLERALQRASESSPFKWKVCVDTSAVLERSWAALAGLGWIGKNTLLIHPKHGSYLFLAEALVDRKLGLAPAPLADYCGHCTRCLDACPTKAFPSPRSLDANRCISYWTLERKGEAPLAESDRAGSGTWVAGCDLCQEVCPFNVKAARAAEASVPAPGSPAILSDWAALLDETEEAYRARVKGSSLSRVKPAHFARNLATALVNAADSLSSDVRAPLERRIAREKDAALKQVWLSALAKLVNSRT
jgi:epoxyqueuosine reductase